MKQNLVTACKTVKFRGCICFQPLTGLGTVPLKENELNLFLGAVPKSGRNAGCRRAEAVAQYTATDE